MKCDCFDKYTTILSLNQTKEMHLKSPTGLHATYILFGSATVSVNKTAFAQYHVIVKTVRFKNSEML